LSDALMAVDTAPEDLANNPSDARVETFDRPDMRHVRDRDESVLILETLQTCAATFGTERARFLRQVPGGEWQVHSIQQDMLVTHRADYAEIGMAWAVGLSRFPIRVMRPRVTNPDGGNVRPIAVTTYFGIPVLCADHFVGVIELAGNVSGDLVRTLETISGDLERFGNRLVHDPSLRAPQHIDMECECWIDGGCWTSGEIDLSSDEWRVVWEVGNFASLPGIAERLSISEEELVCLVRGLVSKGVMTVRAATRSLVEHDDIFHQQIGMAAGD
jgi:hypothetical protein